MSDSVMIVLVIGAAIILLVLAYNIYQESQYRKQLREQFGHANKDALLDSQVNSVRDGAQAAPVLNTKTMPSVGEADTAAPSSVQQSEAADSEKTKQVTSDNAKSEEAAVSATE